MGYVVKIGGSLVNQGYAVVARALAFWRQRAGREPMLLVVGGGAPVDGLRVLARGWPVDDRLFHPWALAIMDMNATLVAAHFGLATIERLDQWTAGAGIQVWVGAQRLAHIAELDASWRTTSDTVAAWLGYQLQAEVGVVKALPPPSAAPWRLTLENASLWRPHFDDALIEWVERVPVWWSGPAAG
ncbi:MAG: hypothetical protein OWU84_10420 [Firmicutes bacterium]|nr:hypothetical protein [Bacillota bacterium]